MLVVQSSGLLAPNVLSEKSRGRVALREMPLRGPFFFAAWGVREGAESATGEWHRHLKERSSRQIIDRRVFALRGSTPSILHCFPGHGLHYELKGARKP